MTTVLGCIADDFTGATDLAGLLARSGMAVSLHIGVPDAPPEDDAPFRVIALKCRTVPADDAVAECRAALAWLQKTGAQRFYWKYCSTFDSTDKGNIGPVAEALMTDLGIEQTIYCPAFPENGRAIFMGNLFVGQQLLSESPMRDHPLTPMRDSNLMRLLTPQVKGQVGLADRHKVAEGPEALKAELDRMAKGGTAHVIVDAVANADLTIIAEACRHMSLMTGGSALAMPLPDLYLADGLLAGDASRRKMPNLSADSIVLSGSCSAMTQAQVSTYVATGAPAYRLDPLDLAANGIGAALEWLSGQTLSGAPLIYATADPEAVRTAQQALGTEAAGAIVEAALADIAVAALNAGARRFVIAGGETSGAVTKALGITDLTVGAEIAPGVPWCFGRSAGQDIALTLKSGNFGAETFFADALAQLETA
jgi:3-dehydrotetronate 4-kinase